MKSCTWFERGGPSARRTAARSNSLHAVHSRKVTPGHATGGAFVLLPVIGNAPNFLAAVVTD
jgi:hypothetical protein